MEAVGAAASFIAIGQALAAIPKLVSAIESVVKTREELSELLFELEILAASRDDVRMCLDLLQSDNFLNANTATEPVYIKRLESALSGFITQLLPLARDCNAQRISPKTRAKWLWQKPKIASLCEKARRMQQHLESSMARLAFQATLNDRRSQNKLLVEIHAVTTLKSFDQGRVTDIGTPDRSEVSRFGATTFSSLVSRSRDITCSCICHKSPRQSMSLSKIIFPSTSRDLKCRCHCVDYERHYDLSYNLLQWLAKSYAGIAQHIMGRRLDISLTVPIYMGSSVAWDVVVNLPRSLASDWLIRHRIPPSGRNMNGESIFEYAVTHKQWDILLFWLQNYSHMITGTVVRRAALDSIHRLYGSSYLPDEAVHACRRISDLAEQDQLIPIYETMQNSSDLAQTLEFQPDMNHELDGAGETPLHIACRSGNLEACIRLIECGADVNCKDLLGNTPLHIAAKHRLVRHACVLLDAGSDINAVNDHQLSPLFTAMNSTNLAENGEMVIYLLKRGSSIQMRTVHRYTVLHRLCLYSVSYGVLVKCLTALFEAGGRWQMEARDCHGGTPLACAVIWRNDRMVRLLLDAGARTDFVDNYGGTILHLTSIARDVSLSVLHMLKEARIAGLDTRTTTISGWTPLGFFRYGIRTGFGDDPTYEAPSREGIEAFEDLLRDIRDRGIKTECDELEDVISLIRDGHQIEAREALTTIREAKTKARIDVEAETFRAIELDVRKGDFDLAIESLEIYMKESRARLNVSPFDEEPDWWVSSDSKDDSEEREGDDLSSNEEDVGGPDSDDVQPYGVRDDDGRTVHGERDATHSEDACAQDSDEDLDIGSLDI